jgi:hypothetical protein
VLLTGASYVPPERKFVSPSAVVTVPIEYHHCPRKSLNKDVMVDKRKGTLHGVHCR